MERGTCEARVCSQSLSAKMHSTPAASENSPIALAPATATTMSELMSHTPRLSDAAPLSSTGGRARAMATTATSSRSCQQLPKAE